MRGKAEDGKGTRSAMAVTPDEAEQIVKSWLPRIH